MPRWKPEQKWLNADAYIIGGGDSLRNFNFDLLKDKLTIGCNAAFLKGHEVCKITLMGDIDCFNHFKDKLEKYQSQGGIVFTHIEQLQRSKLPWLWIMSREFYGLHKTVLGWNDNTGFSAINLALILGAKNIYLLGFDMKFGNTGNANWHEEYKYKSKVKSDVFDKFLRHEKRIAADLKNKFAGQNVFNVTDDSNLNIFPKIGTKEFWKGK